GSSKDWPTSRCCQVCAHTRRATAFVSHLTGRVAPEMAVPAGLLEDLNPVQREAVTHPGGPLLIVAGAGSGKTRVLTHRIGWLIHSALARSGEFLAITLTNSAVAEVREGVLLRRVTSARASWVVTSHAACSG